MSRFSGFLFSSSIFLLVSCVTASRTDCSAMFTTGILKADSSTLQSTSNSADLDPYKAIVNTSKAWCAATADMYQYLHIELGRVRNITSIDIQGYNPGFSTYVKTFTITYYQDGLGWQYVKDELDDPKVFINDASNENDIINHPVSLSTTRLRLNPQSWYGWICMKIELYTSDPVNGGFSGWSSWGQCMLNHTQIKTRSCNSPPPARGGLICEGNFTMSQPCTPNIKASDQSDQCDSKPCQNGSPCISTGSNYTCNCTIGFIGPNCTFLDPCSPNPCMNGSTCLSFVNSTTIDYMCNCTQGFEGKNCTRYKDIIWKFTSEKQHGVEEVLIPVVAGVTTSAAVSGSVGFLYWIVKRRLNAVMNLDISAV